MPPEAALQEVAKSWKLQHGEDDMEVTCQNMPEFDLGQEIGFSILE